MTITLVDSAICTLDDIKDYIDISGQDPKQNDLLRSLINRVTYLFHTECNRIFKTDDYTEYRDGDNTNILYTNQFPITDITSIHDDDDWEWGSDTLIDSDDYRITQDETGVLIKDDVFDKGYQNIKIVYTAGYATVPYDIVQAAVEEVVVKYQKRKTLDVTSKSVGDGSVVYLQKGLQKTTLMTLEKYRSFNLP